MRVGLSGTPPFGPSGTPNSDDQEHTRAANPQKSALNRVLSNHPNRRESFGFLLTPEDSVESIGASGPEKVASRAWTASPRSALTDVELVFIERRLELSLRFGRVAVERVEHRATRIVSFRPNAVFALVCQTASDFGAVLTRIDIMRAPAPGEVPEMVPSVRPGGERYLSLEGGFQVRAVLDEIDAIEAAGVDPCDVPPDHWRHVDERMAVGALPRRYSVERHAAWLKRKAIES